MVVAAPLKDRYDRAIVESLANRVAELDPGFPVVPFTDDVLAAFPELELKERVNLVADRLATDLPDHYPDALAIVVAAAEPGLDAWAAWPLCSFVERHGVDWPDESLEAMTTLTQLWSCEFAIRPFLDAHLELTREYMRTWVTDPRETVRRLPSEGSRPLLPWGPKVRALIDDPQIGIEALTALRHDPSETVRRSVANHLNDVAKAHPDLVVELLAGWVDESRPVDDRMVRHALRTLVKRGHTGALGLLGYTTEPEIDVTSFVCEPSTVHLGDHIELTVELSSTSGETQLLVIDFVIHHVNASGVTSPKVFKWATHTIEPGEMVRLSKRRLIETASTRRYHAGRHQVDLQVAGGVLASAEFELADSSPPR